MLKISIVLVTTTAFAALLIAYPFSPHPAAQASGDVAQVATAALPEQARPTTPQPDPAPQGIAGLPPDGAPARTGSVGSEPAAERGDAPTTVARTDPGRTPDPRIPPRPSHPERQGVYGTVTYPRTEVVARPVPPRWEVPVAAGTRYLAYTGRTAVYPPPGGTVARHSSVGRTSGRPAQRVHRYRSLAWAPDQPIR